MQDLVFYNLIYFLFAFFLVYPPTEIQLLGFSIPTLFASSLGSEQLVFIHHQIARICLTVFIHGLLPLGYYIFIGLNWPDANLFDMNAVSVYWRVFFLISVSIAAGVTTLVYYWRMDNFKNHPLATCLSHGDQGRDWRHAANQINVEFRRVDKFSTGSSFYNRIYVTDNWLIKVNLYSVNLCRLDSMDLVLTHSTELSLSVDQTSPSTQYLSILVKPTVESRQRPFYIQVNSLEYKDFNDKVNTPIRSTCDIVIRQSLPDQFLEAFQQQIANNGSVQVKRDEVETCIGCMRKLADVKLQKMCEPLETGECRSCLCKPMWCLECMGKWFAYRQDQSQPNTWLAGKATCATCRATFCMLDVASIELVD